MCVLIYIVSVSQISLTSVSVISFYSAAPLKINYRVIYLN